MREDEQPALIPMFVAVGWMSAMCRVGYRVPFSRMAPAPHADRCNAGVAGGLLWVVTKTFGGSWMFGAMTP